MGITIGKNNVICLLNLIFMNNYYIIDFRPIALTGNAFTRKYPTSGTKIQKSLKNAKNWDLGKKLKWSVVVKFQLW